MARENAYDKATRYLAEGRVIVLEASRHGIAAHIRGDGTLYVTRYSFGRWDCTCDNPRPTCSHIAALKRISAVDLPRNQPGRTGERGSRPTPQTTETRATPPSRHTHTHTPTAGSWPTAQATEIRPTHVQEPVGREARHGQRVAADGEPRDASHPVGYDNLQGLIRTETPASFRLSLTARGGPDDLQGVAWDMTPESGDVHTRAVSTSADAFPPRGSAICRASPAHDPGLGGFLCAEDVR